MSSINDEIERSQTQMEECFFLGVSYSPGVQLVQGEDILYQYQVTVFSNDECEDDPLFFTFTNDIEQGAGLLKILQAMYPDLSIHAEIFG